jgi:2,3-bisphosphoglycerate-dependent phosphoglycerate mutase
VSKEYKLILLRHGESQWNALNLFTGWVDVDLSEKGVLEAKRGGELLKEKNLIPNSLHTSVLNRAIKTSELALESAGIKEIPTKRSWRLNERHYGALQGLNKKDTLEKYGEEQFMLWRRSYDVPPPPIDPNDKYAQNNDPKYKDMQKSDIPLTECLKDVVKRVIPYWKESIVPELESGKTVLVVAHGNSLRALIKYLENISDENIAKLNLPTGIPLLYRLDENFKPIVFGGEYLDPQAAKEAIDAVANQGKK